MLSDRERAILRAVAAGRGVVLSGGEPALAIDGVWCDPVATGRLMAAGLIGAADSSVPGQHTPAVATETGRALLGRIDNGHAGARHDPALPNAGPAHESATRGILVGPQHDQTRLAEPVGDRNGLAAAGSGTRELFVPLLEEFLLHGHSPVLAQLLRGHARPVEAWRRIQVRVTDDDAHPAGDGPTPEVSGTSREDAARWHLVLALCRLEGPDVDDALAVLADHDSGAITRAAAAKALEHILRD
jgi:hypothetical protein